MRFMHFARPLARLFNGAPPPAPTSKEPRPSADAASPQRPAGASPDKGDDASRAAAIRKLPDGDSLRALAGLGAATSAVTPASLERVAQARVAELIDTGSIDFATLHGPTEDPSTMLTIAGFCANPAYLTQALEAIDAPRLSRLATDGTSSHVRQLAAQRIEDPTELKQLLRQVRGKDKSVYKIIKQKCDALRAAELKGTQLEAATTALCGSLERHSHRIYDVIYVATLEQFAARWRALEAQAEASLKERARQAIERCRKVIAAHEQQLADQVTQAAQIAAARAAREAAMAQAADAAQQREAAAALAAAKTAELRAAEAAIRAEKTAAESHALRQLSGLVASAHGALRDGNTGRAAGLRRAIEEKLPTLPAVPAHVASQVQKLDAKLNELKQWKDFAVAPKRAELIAEMESLIGAAEPPKVLADRIKQLQEEWKTISKGIVSDSEADWQRFHQASETAYQPCREHFEAQAKLRRENLERRRAVLERLKAFEAAQSVDHPDWRAVATVLKEARQEWRRHFPVERAAGLAAQEEFDASLGRLQARLDAWHGQNVADKKSLIERAQLLLAKEDGREAADGIKRLQQMWKEVGAAPREQEQALWEEFRERCDAVFKKRQHAHAEYTAGLEEQKARAIALCAEAEQGAASAGPELLEAAAMIARWRAAFEALGELPRADERALRQRFDRALNDCQAKAAQRRARDKQESFIHLLEAARLIGAFGCAVAAGAASADREELKSAAETFIAGVERWPKAAPQALKEAWAKAQTAQKADLAAHEAALKILCIRSEIFSSQNTPPEDQALRREYQVQRLVKGMGRQEGNADDWETLAFEWVCVGPAAAATHESLLARFLRCR